MPWVINASSDLMFWFPWNLCNPLCFSFPPTSIFTDFFHIRKSKYFDQKLTKFNEPNFDHCVSRGKGVAKQTPFSGLGLIPIYWSNVRCRGDEENILLCEKDIWQGGVCPQKMAAAVTCSFSQGKKSLFFYFHCVFNKTPDDKIVFVKSFPQRI